MKPLHLDPRTKLFLLLLCVLCAFTVWCMRVVTGNLRTMFVAFLGLVHKVYACGFLAGLVISTTKVGEFLSAMAYLRVPKRLTIPLAVMLRYLPAIGEDWHFIKDAMRLRDVSPTLWGFLKSPAMTVNCIYVPLLTAASKAADELSIASVTRGIENPKPRTCLVKIRMRARKGRFGCILPTGSEDFSCGAAGKGPLSGCVGGWKKTPLLGKCPKMPQFGTAPCHLSMFDGLCAWYADTIKNVFCTKAGKSRRKERTMQEAYTQLPQIDSRLRKNILRMPEAVFQASGIVINGRRIKSFVFTTDLAIIRNCDADAVFAVYPFTPQQAISDAIIKASYIPVFCGVGGGTTKGMRTVSLAKDVESQGAMGVVLNAPISDLNLLAVAKAVDIPVIATVTKEDTDIAARLESGASILNIACGYRTAEVVRKIREQYPQVPLIASGGKTNETVRETILAGANAITYTPPSAQELFKTIMAAYRD